MKEFFKTPFISGASGEGKIGQVSYFWAMDTSEKFTQNLKIMPEDWYYRNRIIRYTTNSFGYRAPEWNQVDWKNSIVIFGCSYIFGDGVDDTETIPYFVEKITGIPTINLGVGGSSQLWHLHNSMLIFENYGAPKAVVFAWPDKTRILRYNEGFKPSRENAGRDGILESYFEQYNRNKNPDGQSYFNSLIARNFWSKNSIFYEYSGDIDVCDITGCDKWPEQLRQHHNYHARDGVHLNHVANLMIAEQICENLKILGL